MHLYQKGGEEDEDKTICCEGKRKWIRKNFKFKIKSTVAL